MKKRGIIISDLHCGHLCGLTPPSYQIKTRKAGTSKRNKWAKLQGEMWDAFSELLDRWGPFHFGFSMGDAIDGTGGRSNGVELITSDREEQVDMAVDAHDQVRLHARRGFEWVAVHGTDYHVGDGEDWENLLCERAGFNRIGSHEWVDVNGCVFDLKHHIGGSSIPHGRHTSIAKDRLWNVLWAERELQPKSNFFARGHVHYHNHCGGPGWVAMTCPALQSMGTKYGSRRCTGLVDWGAIIVDVADDGTFDWHADIVQIQAQKAKVVKL